MRVLITGANRGIGHAFHTSRKAFAPRIAHQRQVAQRLQAGLKMGCDFTHMLKNAIALNDFDVLQSGLKCTRKWRPACRG